MWAGLAIIAFFWVAWASYDFYAHYTEQGENAVAEGQRVVFVLPSGKVVAEREIPGAEKEPEPKKETSDTPKEDKAAAPAEEKEAPAVADEDAGAKEGTEPKEGVEPKEADAPTPKKNEVEKPAMNVGTTGKTGEPNIAIIITDLGLSKATTKEALKLPGDITLSFSPYGSDLNEWMQHARELGFDVMLNMAMEPADYPLSDPGPLALLTQASKSENLVQMDHIFGLVEKYEGLMAPVNERFTHNENSVFPILEALKEKEVLFVYQAKPGNDHLPRLAETARLDYLDYDMIIDENLSPEALDEQLALLESRAKAEGTVLAVGRPYPLTVNRLKSWVKEVESRGVHVIPITSYQLLKKEQETRAKSKK
jgi:hypothetical protein